MTFLEDLLEKLKNSIDKLKSYSVQSTINKIPYNTEDYYWNELTQSWIPKGVDMQEMNSLRLDLQALAQAVTVDNRGVDATGSLLDSLTKYETFEYEDLLFNTVRIIATSSSNIDIDIVISYRNPQDTDWIDIYSESLTPNSTTLNYRINIAEYKNLRVKIINNTGATINYSIILFFSKTKFRDIIVVTPSDDLQVALDEGGAIYLSEGTHVITSMLNIDQNKNVFMYGSGVDSIIEISGNIIAFSITSTKSCFLTKFKIVATDIITASYSVIDINEASDNRVIIDNVTILNENAQSVKIRSNNVIIRECYINSGTNAIILDASVSAVNNVKILNNRIENTLGSLGYASIFLNQDCNEIEIVGNRILDGSIGIYGAGSEQLRCFISNNYIYSSVHYGINLEQTHGSVISNNIIDTCVYGICLSITSSYNNIIGNILIDNSSAGIWLAHANVTYTTLLNNLGDTITDEGTNTRILADDTAYNESTWNSNLGTATKNAVRDKIEAMSTLISNNLTEAELITYLGNISNTITLGKLKMTLCPKVIDCIRTTSQNDANALLTDFAIRTYVDSTYSTLATILSYLANHVNTITLGKLKLALCDKVIDCIRTTSQNDENALLTDQGIKTLVDAKVSNTAYDESTWNNVTTIAPSKNTIRDKFESLPAGFTPAIGTIMMFSGTWEDNVTISGWYKCDGNNGTVNLVDKFIRGGATSGASGGSDDAILKAHVHNLDAQWLTGYGVSSGYGYRVLDGASIANVITSSGESATGKNIPAYYTLIFIQRIS